MRDSVPVRQIDLTGQDYVMLRQCCNCNTNNEESAVACKSCGLLLTHKLTFDEWCDLNGELARKAEAKEKVKKDKTKELPEIVSPPKDNETL